MRRPRHRTRSTTDTNYWPSFTDLMSGFALALVLLMLLSWVHAIVKAYQYDLTIEKTAENLNIQEVILHKLASAQEGSESEGGPGTHYELTENGTIVIKEGVLFDVNEAIIKEDGKPVLDRLARKFLTLLEDDMVRRSIDVILVEGHTDATGSDNWNWMLSSKRAIAVIEYMYEAVPQLRDRYAQFFAAAGYSKYRPAQYRNIQNLNARTIAQANATPTDRQHNRRIEFRVHLDDEFLKRIRQKLENPGRDIGD